MVKTYWGIKQGGVGITWGGSKMFGHSIDIHLLVLTISIQFNDGEYGNKDGE